MKAKTVPVPDYFANDYWHKWMMESAKAGNISEGHVKTGVASRRLLVIGLYSENTGRPLGVLGCEKKGAALNCAYVTGHNFPDGWQDDIIRKLKLLASMHGCKKIVGGGRKGWQRMLKPYGFKFDGELNVLEL